MFYTSTEENLSSLSEQTAAQWGVMMKADGIHTRVWVWSRGGEFMRLFQGIAEILRACVYCLSGTISYWESDGPTPSSPLPSPPFPLCPLPSSLLLSSLLISSFTFSFQIYRNSLLLSTIPFLLSFPSLISPCSRSCIYSGSANRTNNLCLDCSHGHFMNLTNFLKIVKYITFYFYNGRMMLLVYFFKPGFDKKIRNISFKK